MVESLPNQLDMLDDLFGEAVMAPEAESPPAQAAPEPEPESACEPEPASEMGPIYSPRPIIAGDCVFDIETGPLPEGQLRPFLEVPDIDLSLLSQEFDPKSVKLGVMKDPEKIKAKIELDRQKFEAQRAALREKAASAEQDAWQKLIDGAALSAKTGRILAIGYGAKDYHAIQTGDEAALVRAFYQHFTWAYRNNKQMVGFNSDSFDLPWIVRRGMVCGLRPPAGIRTADKRRWANTFVDLLAVYQAGQYRDYISLAHAGLMFGCGAVKTGDGAHFYQLFERDRAAADAYLKTDLRLTWELGEKLFQLE